MIQAKITEIGTEAINKEEPMLILFDKTATAALRKYSVIQEVSKDEPFSLKAGGTIAFDDQVYTIDYVGPMANGNLDTVAHVSLILMLVQKKDKLQMESIFIRIDCLLLVWEAKFFITNRRNYGRKNKKNRPVSWFWRWFLNNQVVTALLVVLLILLIVFLFTKVSYLFAPIWQFLAIVGLPIILAGILYYLMNPVVDYFEKRKVPRLYSIIGLFVLVVALIAWGSVVIIPKIQEQTVSFISNFPQYVDTIDNKLTEILRDPLFNQFREQLETAGDKFMNSAGDMIQDISKSTVQSLGSFVGAVATILVALLTMPFILFYLLKDGKQLAPYFVKFLPTRMQKPTLNVLSEMNSQVSSYIRGQLTVAFAVAIMFMIGFAVIGLEYAVTLGIIAGF